MIWERVPFGPIFLICLSRDDSDGPVTEDHIYRSGNRLARTQFREDLHVPNAVREARRTALCRLSGPYDILADASQGEIIPDDHGDYVDW